MIDGLTNNPLGVILESALFKGFVAGSGSI